VPASHNELELELPRFRTERLTLPTEPAGTVDVLLTLQPDWRDEAAATIDQPPTVDDRGAAYLVDRKGAIFALDLAQQRQLWRLETGDPAGYLSPPLLHGNLVLVASLDGSVRAIDRASGVVRWQRGGLPVEFAPVLCENRLALATN